MNDENNLENRLTRIHEWTRSADEKTSIWLAFQGLIVPLTIPLIEQLISKQAFFCNKYLVVLFVIGLIFSFGGIISSMLGIIPRLKHNHKDKSLIHFNDIASFSLSDFQKTLKKESKENYKEDLIRQIYTCAQIAKRKHELFRNSVVSFLGGIGILLTLAILIK